MVKIFQKKLGQLRCRALRAPRPLDTSLWTLTKIDTESLSYTPEVGILFKERSPLVTAHPDVFYFTFIFSFTRYPFQLQQIALKTEHNRKIFTEYIYPRYIMSNDP